MRRSKIGLVVVILVGCLLAIGFYRGWMTLSMNRQKMEQDAATVKKEASDLVGKVKENTTGTAQPTK